MRLFAVIFPAVLISLLLASGAQALGISPARTLLDFSPGMSGTIPFVIYNTESKGMTVELYVRGVLEEYVTCNTESVYLSPNIPTAGMTCTYSLPQTLEKYGILDTRIGLLEVMEHVGQGASLGGRVGIESQFWIDVPYPGYYAEIVFGANDVAVGETVEFTVSINNRGTNPISASGEIRVYEGEREIAVIQAGSVSISPQDSKSLLAEWSTEGISPGQYRAVVTVDYNGKTATSEVIINIGKLSIRILDMEKVIVQEKEIAKFQIGISSIWNDQIDGIFIELDVLKGGNVWANGKSETFSLDPWEDKEVSLFVDTEDLVPGEYDIRTRANYAEKTEERLFEGSLVVGSPSVDQTLIIGAAVVVILVVIAGAFKYKRKEKKR